MFLHSQHPFYHVVSMNHKIGQSFANGFVQGGVVFSFYSLQHKRAFDVAHQLWQYTGEEVIEIIFPCAVIRQAIAPPASRESVCLVDIVHADMIKPLADRQTFSKHKKPRRRQPLTPGRALHRIAAKIH